MGRSRRAFVSLASVAVAAMARVAVAGPGSPLEIVGDGGRSWDTILRDIQDNPSSLGRTYPLGVRSGATAYGCDEYALSFDDAGRGAFTIDGCDVSTGMTRVRVVSREPLFDRTGFVPRPLQTSVSAVLTQHARATGGGATPEGGSRVGCSVRLEPYLWDGLRGVPVPLPWDRFEVRPLSEDVHAAPDGTGWIARGESRMSLSFRYEVVDRKTGETVLRNEATLVCEDKPLAPPDPIAAPLVPNEPATATPTATQPDDVHDRSLASLKLKVVDLALLRNDDTHFHGAFQLGPYNGATELTGGLQLGITNTAGIHPWGLPKPPSWRARGTGYDLEAVPVSRSTSFRGVGEVGVLNAVDDDFSGAVQVGGFATFVGGAFRGFAQVGALGAGMGGPSVAALQLGGLVAYADELTGVQVSPCIAAAGTIHGIQVGGCGALATRAVEGLQIGGGNMIFETKRHGEVADPATLRGAQIGQWNYASRVEGVQIGGVNIGLTVHGLQIGVVNYASHLRGVQIGAINIAANGAVPFMPVVNASLGG